MQTRGRRRFRFQSCRIHFDGDRWVDNDGNAVVISTDGWYNVEWLVDAEGKVTAVLVGCMVQTASGFGSIKGAKAVAIFSSFHETCKKHGIRLREYLEFLFSYIGAHRRELNNPDFQSRRKMKYWRRLCHGILKRPEAGL